MCMSIDDKVPFKWTPHEQASHVIIGYCAKCGSGGIMMTAKNELEAYRMRKWYRAHGYPKARIELDNEETSKQVSDELTDLICWEDSHV